MQPRIDYRKFAQEPLKHMLGLEKYIAESGLDPKLVHLLKMRASQINGCAYCLDMHSIDARAAGESEQRLYTLEAWRETPFFSDRERAALAWTESLTLIAQPTPPMTSTPTYKSISARKRSSTSLSSWVPSISGIGWPSQCARCPATTNQPRRHPPHPPDRARGFNR